MSVLLIMIRNRDEAARYRISQIKKPRWGEEFDCLPDEIKQALSRLSELFHCYLGCTTQQSIQIGRRISTSGDAILKMDVETLAAFHAENLSLIKEVEAIPSLKRVFD